MLPFTYGKVIGILHADVGLVSDIGHRPGGPEYSYHRIEFLWVRWYRSIPGDHPESARLPLDEVELIGIDEAGAHGFVNPLHVTRACHIIPNFKYGRRFPQGVGKSTVADDKKDYQKYFINRQGLPPFMLLRREH